MSSFEVLHRRNSGTPPWVSFLTELIEPAWQTAIATFVAHLVAGGVPPGTVKTRCSYLTRLARVSASPWQIGLDDLVEWLAGYPHWSPETRRSAITSVRVFYRWAVDTGRMDADPTLRLRAVKIPASVPRPTPEEIFQRALTTAPPRDRLMLLLAATCGLRRGEIARIHSTWLVGDSLHVIGKGGRRRVVPVLPTLAHRLGSRPHGYIFPGKIAGHISPDRVGHILADLLGPGWSGHTLRHRFATRAYSADRDLLAVQQLLGHSSVATTQRYTQVPDGALRRAATAAAA